MENGEGCFEHLQVVETGWAPESESALLRDLLVGEAGHADPLNALAPLNAYKHRLHALRRDYVNARLRIFELEEQLARSQLSLQQIQLSRGWQMVERYRRWRRAIARWFQRLRVFAAPSAGLPCPRMEEVDDSCRAA